MKFDFYYWCYGKGEGEQIFVKSFLQKDSDWMPHTGQKCLNANFFYYATQLPRRGGGAFFIWSDFCLFLFLQVYFFNCLQSTVIKCLLNFIYWTPQLPRLGGAIITYFYWSCVYKYITSNAWVSALSKKACWFLLGYFLNSEYIYFFLWRSTLTNYCKHFPQKHL